MYLSTSGQYFNEIWYRETYNYTGPNALEYYSTVGHLLDHNPSIHFNTKWYRETYDTKEQCPLTSFCNSLGKKSNFKYLPNPNCKFHLDSTELMINGTFVNIMSEFIPLPNELKRINILLPALSMSAGPMTAYILASLLSPKYNVRIISLYANIDKNFSDSIKERIPSFPSNIEIESFTSNVKISYDDVFIATAWWTVYPLKFILGYLNFKRFFWLIQENELVLHSCNNDYSMALECYNMDYISFVNTSLLLDNLIDIKLGPFSSTDYTDCIAFEPAFDRNLFKYEKHNGKKRIIFYSRGENIAERNLFGLCVNLLKSAVKNNIITDEFEIISFGDDNTKRLDLGKGIKTLNVGFLGLNKYSELIRSADILISFQLAPHPSYPPLEISYCNGVCLHTNFGSKNQDSISRYTDKIIMAEPNLMSLLEGLEKCIKLVKNGIEDKPPKLLNSSWDISLDQVIKRIDKEMKPSDIVLNETHLESNQTVNENLIKDNGKSVNSFSTNKIKILNKSKYIINFSNK